MAFGETDIGDQRGRVAVVTGANSGIGYETARALAEHGATVVLACRSREKGEAALARLRAGAPEADVALMPLDLADLGAVATFAAAVRERYARIDLLVNNAGVMMPPRRSETADGFELQLGTNHLGHFALTGALLDRVRSTPGGRVVTVSSLAHRMGQIDFDDLQWTTRRYKRMAAYSQSKLANLLFSRELGRRLAAAGADTVSAAAHPGYTATNLQNTVTTFKVFNPVVGQSPPRGALPTLYAAVAPDVRSGDYFGPGGLFEMRGRPKPAKVSARAQDESVAARLWAVSEELTGVRYLS